MAESQRAGGRARPWAGLLAASVAASVLAWRIAALPLNRLWFDWAAVLSVYWIASWKAGDSKRWPTVTASVIGFLLAIHLLGQVRHSLAVLGLP